MLIKKGVIIIPSDNEKDSSIFEKIILDGYHQDALAEFFFAHKIQIKGLGEEWQSLRDVPLNELPYQLAAKGYCVMLYYNIDNNAERTDTIIYLPYHSGNQQQQKLKDMCQKLKGSFHVCELDEEAEFFTPYDNISGEEELWTIITKNNHSSKKNTPDSPKTLIHRPQ